MVGTAHADPLLGSMLGKDYRVLERIGMGGMAVVYLVEHQSLLKHFAAKVLSAEHAASAEARARFTQEAHAASQLDHENIVTISDFGITADQRPYFVMELLRGMTLADRLDDGPMIVEEVVAICVPVARALSHAHAEGIIHRDVKPENVFLVQRSQNRWGVKVLDFGIAKVGANDRMTKTGQALGSPMFMAPEACRGDEIDQRADVYSFGILLYLMFAGRVPFSDENLLKVLRMQVSAPLPLPSSFNADLPQPIEAVIVRALAKDPEDRYPTIDALLSDFEAVLPEGADVLLIQAQFGVSQTPFPGSIERVRSSQRFLATTGQHHVVTGPFNVVTGRHQVTVTGSHRVEPRIEPAAFPPAPRRRGGKTALAVVALLALGGGAGFAWMQFGRDREPAVIAASDPSSKIGTSIHELPTEPTAAAAPTVPTPTEPTPTEPTPTEPAPTPTLTEDEPAAVETPPTPAAEQPTPRSKKAPPKRVSAATPKPATSKQPPPPKLPATAKGTSAPAGSGSGSQAVVVSPVSATEAPTSSTDATPPSTAKQQTTDPLPVPAPSTAAPIAPPKKLVGSLDATPTIASLDVNGPLPSSIVRRGIDRVLPALRDCYRAAAKAQQTTPAVSLTMSFEIDESSVVRDVSARGGSFGPLAACVRGVVGRVQSPQAPDVGTAHVVLALKFTPI